MNGIPQELDEIMWSLADRHDVAANADFLAKHPHLEDEFSKRCALIKQFRGAKVAAPATMPPFLLHPRPAIGSIGKGLIVGLSIAGLAVTSFVITNSLLSHPDAGEPRTKPAISSVEPFDTSENVEPPSRRRPNNSPDGDLGGKSFHKPRSKDAVPSAPEAQQSPMKTPITLQVERIELVAALEEIAHRAGYQLVNAPDMLNPEVKLDYVDATPEFILSDLGKRYGFTIFDEGGSQLLAIPAVDKAKGEGGFVTEPAQVPLQNTR